jgi:RNA polymerase sigma-70 factor (ECF subfamily)
MEESTIQLTELTDPELVDLARGGNRQAFSELVQRHWRKCVGLGCLFLRNRGDAEDETQNAVFKAWEHLDQYQGEAEFSTWLARIVANQCLMLMRARRRATFVYLDDVPLEPRGVPIQLAASDPDPEGELSYLQLSQVLRHEVGRIPPLMRNVMLLRDIQGLPMSDVADQLGITVSAAKSRLVRARAELRSRVTRHYHPMRSPSPLSRTAAPLSRVGRHCVMQATVSKTTRRA